MDTAANAPRKGIALVTGASAGIGQVFARRLAALGYDLHLVARRADRLDELAREITSAHAAAVTVTAADLTQPAELDSLARAVATDERLTLLVNNAGANVWGPVAQSTPAKAEALIALNVTALTRLTLAALPGFVQRKRGTVINVGSVAAFGVHPGVAIYGASKAYVHTFTRTLQAELRESGVTVQLLVPGPTESEGRAVSGGAKQAPGTVMPTQDFVEAALHGLAQGEVVTAPSIEDGTALRSYFEAGQALLMGSVTGKRASRYAAVE